MRTEKLLLEKRRLGLPETMNEAEKLLLEEGVPVQKIIGFIDFDNLKIGVHHDVLIPRYETQEVVNKALEFVNKDSRVLDLCTGSGYIGLTIKQKTGAEVVMSDIDSEAIKQSKLNAKNNNLDVQIIQSDMFKNIEGKFDVIISNPPYIPESNELPESVMKYDPHTALFGGVDGNDFYKQIVNEYKTYLKPGGKLVLEASEDNTEYLKTEGFTILKDINGKDRIAIK